MYINELKRKIKTNSYPNVMLWVGQETYIKQFYREKISPNWVYLDDFSTINTNKSSFFKNIKQYYFVDGQCLNNISESTFHKEDLKTKLLNNTNVIVFNFTSEIDENGKLLNGPNKFILNEFQDYIISFDKLSEDKLLKHFSYSELSTDRLTKIIKYNNYDYIKCKLEIDKIIAYTNATKITSDIAFDLLLKEGVLYKPVGDVIFDFTSAILSGDLTNINLWYKQLKLSNEHPLTVASLLYKQFKELYYVKSCKDNKTLLNSLNLSPGKLWIINNKYKKTFSLQEIQRNLQIIQYTEAGLKSGLLDENYALDYLLINILL